MSFATTMTALKDKVDGLIANRVAKFAYTQQAYNSDDVNGVTEYAYSAEQNIPTSSASVLKVNETVLTKGWRTQASAITRMLMNHFLGRTSYNLNKTVDFLKAFMLAIENNMGVAEGFATLDENTQLPLAQLTPAVVVDCGEWDADTNTPELEIGEGRKGDTYRVSVAGTQDLGEGSTVYREGDTIIYNGTIWKKTSSGTVSSVNTVTPDENGNVTITGEDINVSASDATKLTDKFVQMLGLSFAWLLGRYWVISNLTSDNYYSPVYANGIWVVTGISSVGIKYSTDGMTWTNSNITSDSYYSPVYANGVWTVSSTGTSGIKYSTDGMTWNNSNVTSGSYKAPVYANGIWEAGGNVGIKYSTDGMTWNDSNVTSGSYKEPVYANGVWVAGSTRIKYSTDGMTWTDSNVTSGSFALFAYANGVWVVSSISSVGIKYSTDGMTWNNSNVTSGNYRAPVYANGVWVVSSTGTSGIKYSTDGMTWNNSNVTSGSYKAPVYANGIWVVSSTGNVGIKYSTDGMTWNDSNVTSGSYKEPVYANGVWVVSSDSSSGSVGIKYSTDGMTWNDSNLTSGNYYSPVYANGIWVAGNTTKGVCCSRIADLIENGWVSLD